MVAILEDALSEKVLAGERISAAEALELYGRPLETLGALANARRDLAKAASYGERGREMRILRGRVLGNVQNLGLTQNHGLIETNFA